MYSLNVERKCNRMSKPKSAESCESIVSAEVWNFGNFVAKDFKVAHGPECSPRCTGVHPGQRGEPLWSEG